MEFGFLRVFFGGKLDTHGWLHIHGFGFGMALVVQEIGVILHSAYIGT